MLFTSFDIFLCFLYLWYVKLFIVRVVLSTSLVQGLVVQSEPEEQTDPVGGGRNTEKCVVCEDDKEEHLMTVCDTCDHHYHIYCVSPPLAKVPKKTAKWGWQCHQCSFTSEDELTPLPPTFDERSSRSGRRIKVPKPLVYPEKMVSHNMYTEAT